MSDYDPKKDIGAAIRLADGIMRKNSRMVEHLDSQTNILIGLSTAVFVLSVNSLVKVESQSLPLVIIAISSGLSTIVSLFAIHPPKFMRKQGQQESLFYQKRISGFNDSQGYKNEVQKVFGDIPEIIDQYSTEIYNIAKYYYRPKRMLFKLSRNIFMIGIVLTFITLFSYIF